MTSCIANLKMNKKILIVPLIVMVLLIALALVSYSGLAAQKGALDDLFLIRFKANQDTVDTIYRMAMVHKNIFRMFGLGASGMDASKWENIGKEQMQNLQDLKAGFAQTANSKNLMAQEKVFYEKALKAIEEYEAMTRKAIQVSGADISLALAMMSPIEERFLTMNGIMEELAAFERQQSKNRYESSLRSYATVMKSFGIVLVAAILLALGAGIFVSRRITAPIRRMIAALQKIAEGDLREEMILSSKDEIGELAYSVESMRLKMGDTVGQCVAMSQTLSEAASQQAASLEETSSSLEEMASMTKQNAGNASQANELMTSARQTIVKADSSMKELTRSMREINQAGEETQKIVKTIDEIAFQTNLLALNAAVEAARAGEAGAGFAVVADEVRNLAMRAAEAARNTTGLMEDIVRKVKNGESLVKLVNEAFQEVTGSSEKVVGLVGEIAAASQEQSQGIDQVNKAVAEMNQTTQHNAASAEEWLPSWPCSGRTKGPPRPILLRPRGTRNGFDRKKKGPEERDSFLKE